MRPRMGRPFSSISETRAAAPPCGGGGTSPPAPAPGEAACARKKVGQGCLPLLGRTSTDLGPVLVQAVAIGEQRAVGAWAVARPEAVLPAVRIHGQLGAFFLAELGNAGHELGTS